MKKSVFFLLVLATITVFGAALSEGATLMRVPLVGDTVTVYNTQELGGDIGVLTYNNTQNTAAAVIVDVNGNPDPYLTGVANYFVDYTSRYIWGCNSACDDPQNWEILETF